MLTAKVKTSYHGAALAVGVQLIIAALAGVAWAAPQGRLEKTVFFAGFSTDETKAAWHIQIDRFGPSGPGQWHDRYAVVRIVETHTNTTLGSYRFGKIERVDKYGNAIGIKSRKLAAENPIWAAAGRESDWKALEGEYDFRAVRLSAATTIAIRPDPDVDLHARAGEEGTVHISAGGNLLGYVLAMATGRRNMLGRYRHEAQVGQVVTSKLEVLTSLRGDYVAVVNRFDIEGADPDEPSTLTYGKIVPITRSGDAGQAGKIWVRTAYGWSEMTPEQERIWRRSHTEQVGLAKLLHQLADGSY